MGNSPSRGDAGRQHDASEPAPNQPDSSSPLYNFRRRLIQQPVSTRTEVPAARSSEGNAFTRAGIRALQGLGLRRATRQQTDLPPSNDSDIPPVTSFEPEAGEPLPNTSQSPSRRPTARDIFSLGNTSQPSDVKVGLQSSPPAESSAMAAARENNPLARVAGGGVIGRSDGARVTAAIDDTPRPGYDTAVHGGLPNYNNPSPGGTLPKYDESSS